MSFPAGSISDRLAIGHDTRQRDRVKRTRRLWYPVPPSPRLRFLERGRSAWRDRCEDLRNTGTREEVWAHRCYDTVRARTRGRHLPLGTTSRVCPVDACVRAAAFSTFRLRIARRSSDERADRRIAFDPDAHTASTTNEMTRRRASRGSDLRLVERPIVSYGGGSVVNGKSPNSKPCPIVNRSSFVRHEDRTLLSFTRKLSDGMTRLNFCAAISDECHWVL